MTVGGQNVAGPVRNGLVQNVPREIVVGEDAGVPADAIHPGPLVACREVPHALLQLGKRPRAAKIGIEAVAVTGVLEMDVRVLKAGQHHAAAGIDDARGRSGKRPHVRVAAEGEHAAVASRTRLQRAAWRHPSCGCRR